MKITLHSTDKKHGYTGTNNDGHTMSFTGGDDGVRPMQSVLMSMAACSAIDLEIFLKKMRQDMTNLLLEVEGHRVEKEPRVFNKVHIHYKVYGNELKPEKVEKATAMAIEQYCSVATMLAHSVEITHSVEVLENKL